MNYTNYTNFFILLQHENDEKTYVSRMGAPKSGAADMATQGYRLGSHP